LIETERKKKAIGTTETNDGEDEADENSDEGKSGMSERPAS
jgi:hypothetical protein